METMKFKVNGIKNLIKTRDICEIKYEIYNNYILILYIG